MEIRSTEELLTLTYGAFNRHDIDTVLAVMHPDVDWANGMEGGRIHGHDQVREYWTRLWTVANPEATPLMFVGSDESQTMVVHVQQIIRDLSGNVLVEQLLQHVYTMRDGLIERMDIQDADAETMARYL